MKYINQEEAIEKLLQAANMNNSLLWLAVSMSTIAAINSMDGPSIFYKVLVFMLIGITTLLFYQKKFKK